jgi:hypothetical protein
LPKDADPRALFAFDKASDGSKSYVRASYTDFVDHLARIAAGTASIPKQQGFSMKLMRSFVSELTAYELMRPNRPTRLFLDLEYDKPFNKGLVELDMLQKTIAITAQRLHALYEGYELKEACIYTASNDKKCSFHLIFPAVVFENYRAVHAFIRDDLVPSFKEKVPDVFKMDGSKVCFIDALGGGHRAFRLPYSHKKVNDVSLRRPLLPVAPMVTEKAGSNAWKEQILAACVQNVEGHGFEFASKKQRKQHTSGFESIIEPAVDYIRGIKHPKTGVPRDITDVSFCLDRLCIFMSSRDHWCDFKRGSHSHNYVYYCVDLNKRVFFQGCYSQARCGACRADRVEYKLPDTALSAWDAMNDCTALLNFLQENVV